MFDQKTLKQVLEYSPDTGDWWWKVSRGRAVKPGDKAGGVDHEGYVRIRVFGKKYKAHRLAFLYMEGEWPPNEVDHINRKRADNRWCNLRHATRFQNAMNHTMQSNNKSGFIGVHYDKEHGKWRAEIRKNRKSIFLGRYERLHDAVEVRRRAEVKLFGEYRHIGMD